MTVMRRYVCEPEGLIILRWWFTMMPTVSMIEEMLKQARAAGAPSTASFKINGNGGEVEWVDRGVEG